MMGSVAELIERMMLGGTHPQSGRSDWALIPRSPIDVFAVTAVLVERSGAYRFVVVPAEDSGGDAWKDQFDLGSLQGTDWDMVAKAWSFGIHPNIDRTGAEWKKFVLEASKLFPDKSSDDRVIHQSLFEQAYYSFTDLELIDVRPLQALWKELYVSYGSHPVVAEDPNQLAKWWPSALKLMILADMACAGVGFRKRRRGGKESIETTVQKEVLDKAAKADSANPKIPYLTTITEVVDSSFCTVLPKTRTSSLGCTLRSLTHNLALLPSPGLVEARWRIPGESPPHATDTGDPNYPPKPLNLLLLPFPYRISSKCFVGRLNPTKPKQDWSYFDLEQRWLPHDDNELTELVRFFGDLVEDAAKDLEGIHGVVLPECALDAKTFDAVCDELIRRKARTGFEFIVAGLSEEAASPATIAAKPTRKRGNFVSVRGAAFEQDGVWDYNTAREKHHRWKLNRSQIERYGLSASLAVDKNWWEAIPLGRRVVEFFEPRAGTSMTVLICEDLARADPCQTVVRSVGPNLVLALLLDGPQRKFRWPGHYAGVLADDPGSSVLSLTSYGLIARGAAVDEYQSRSIALFRNSTGQERELFLPSGFHALAVRLKAGSKTEHTLDGRGDGNSAFIWTLHEVSPIRGRLDERNRWIVEGVR